MIDFIKMPDSSLKLTELTFGSALTIGTENRDIGFAKELLKTAWDSGIRSFDTSNNYGEAESILGKVLCDFPREQFVLATKGSWPIGESVFHKGLSRKHITWAIEESLKKLNVDYVDIYYAHRYDPETPMVEIVRTFNRLIESGKALHWATSEWPLEALIECHEVCERLQMEKPILEQFIYSYAINKSDNNGVKQFCLDNNVGMLGFSPLAQGLLTGKYKNEIPDGSRIAKSESIGYNKTAQIYLQTKERVDHFNTTCDKYGINGCHAAIQWSLRQGVLPVIGASRPEQIVENCQALSQSISDDFWAELSSL